MFGGAVLVRFHTTKEMSGPRNYGQLKLIKVNEYKCVIKGKLAGHLTAYQGLAVRQDPLSCLIFRSSIASDEKICAAGYLVHTFLLYFF
jgi:hypothetical protein